jgi:hypothetical protein
MKTISPVSIWQNGQNVQAIYLKAEVQSDNLIDYASFAYMLCDADFLNVNNGLVSISGKDYIAYQTNQYAWDYIATSLNLTITGDYIPPAPIVEEVVESNPSVVEFATVTEVPNVSE